MSGLVFLDGAVLLERLPTDSAPDEASGVTPYEKQQLDEIQACLHLAQASTGALTPKPGDFCLDSNETSKLPAGMAHALERITARPDTWRAFLSEAKQHYLVRNAKWEESLLPHRWTELPIRVFTASVASLSDEASAPLYGLPASDHKAISQAREGRRHWEALQARICEFSLSCKSYLIPTSEHLVQNVVPDRVVRSIKEIEALRRLSGEQRGLSGGE